MSIDFDNRDRALSISPEAFAWYYGARDQVADPEDLSVALDAYEEDGEEAADEFINRDWDIPATAEIDWKPEAYVHLDELEEMGSSSVHVNFIKPPESWYTDPEMYAPLTRIQHTAGDDTIARSNRATIEAEEEENEFVGEFLVWSYGGYGGDASEALVRMDRGPIPQWLYDVIGSLESYSILDEGGHSELEMEDETEAWADHGYQDFAAALILNFPEEYEDTIDDLSTDDLWELYRQGAEGDNLYVSHSEEGVSFPYEEAANWIYANSEQFEDVLFPADEPQGDLS